MKKEKYLGKTFIIISTSEAKMVVLQRVWVNLLLQNKQKWICRVCNWMVAILGVSKKVNQRLFNTEKKAITTNNLFLCDNEGQLLAMSLAMAGNHYDLWKIKEHFEAIFVLLKEAEIEYRRSVCQCRFRI